jgi:hypothetical protein
MYFDGVDDYVLVPHSPSLYLTSFTVVMWANVPCCTNYDFNRFIEKGGWTDGGGFDIEVSGGGPPTEANFLVWSGGMNWFGLHPLNYPFIDSLFHHIVFMYDNLYIWVYIDNVLRGSTSVSAYTPSTEPISIGKNCMLDAGYLNGYIAQVLIYSRALSASEVQQNYLDPDHPVTDGLVLWLKADPAYISGSTWYDLSGNNNNGTIYGATLVELTPGHYRQLQAERVLSPVR